MASTNVIGDSQEAAVQPIVADTGTLGIVTQVAVAAVANPVNLAMHSGKREGAMYIMSLTAGGNEIIVATGSAANDPWIRMGALKGATAAKVDWAVGDVGTAADIAIALNTLAASVNAIITGATITPA